MQPFSPQQTILLAKQRHLDALTTLTLRTSLVEHIALMIHQIQIERGASCLYLASSGLRFASTRSEVVLQNQTLEQEFRQTLQQYVENNALDDAKQLTLISWILLGFDQAKVLRHQVTLQKISFTDCLQSFTRLIGSLIALIFELTDKAVNSKVSGYLLSLYNLIQAKEFAGQERALGAYMLGSGEAQAEYQQQLAALVDLQARHFEVFSQFCPDALSHTYEKMMQSGANQQHIKYRQSLLLAEEGKPLKTSDADVWFDLCSQRMDTIWEIQCELMGLLRTAQTTLVQQAKDDLQATQQFVEQLSSETPASQPGIDSTFFNLSIPVEHGYTFLGRNAQQEQPIESIIALLQQQSHQIAEMESELSDAKKALAERKQIERAKGILMNAQGMSEMEAYKWMRSTAMEQSRKIIDVAENILKKYK